MFLPRRTIKFSAVIALIVALLFFLRYIGALSPFENAAAYVFRPFQRGIYFISSKMSGYYKDLKEVKDLREENAQLKEQVGEALVKQSYCAETEEENKFLREQIKFFEKKKYTGVAARVIGKGSDMNLNALVVDKGANHGIAKGQPVVSAGGILVGKIFKVKASTSLVLLINDNFSKVAATTFNEARTVGMVEGEYGLGIKMNFIPPEEKIFDGDLVVTSGIEDGVPRGLVIGTISSVVKKPESLFQQASVRSPVEFGKLYLLTILVDG
jgi:rod shape-determining protein MreC